MKNKKRLITSALPYVNNVPHLGNIIGCVLSADVFARYSKMAGFEVAFISGTDEYGTTTETKAKQEGVTPKEICDKYNKIHREIYKWFNIDFTYFGRTTDKKQTEIVQGIFKKLHENGFIVEDIVTQPYCEHDKMFLADRFIEGTCPNCGFENAKGDQCDACGKLLDPSDLKSPKCSICKTTPIFKNSKHLFLDLIALKNQLESWIKETAVNNNWSNNALTVTNGWLEIGLKKRCITRDLDWGIPVPLDGYEGKVFYVWFDAPIGYISMTAEYTENWKEWWQSPDNVDLYQFMGKDNIPFHTVLFPSSLIGTGEKWTMLKTISSTEYLNYEDSKFSKSRGAGIFGDQAISSGISSDLYRYYLLRNRPEKNDTNFYWNDFMEKVNGEIIANYANLVNRVLQFITRFFDSRIPDYTLDKFSVFSSLNIEDRKAGFIKLMEDIELKKALLDILDISSCGNKFFQDLEPWNLEKSNKLSAGSVIGSLACLLKDITIMLSPYIPDTASRVFKMMNIPLDRMKIDDIGNYTGICGTTIGKPEILFTKIEKDTAENLKTRFAGQDMESSKNQNKKANRDPLDMFSDVVLKTGKIISVEKHPKADKLFIEKVDMGNGEIRQIVSGLVAYYREEELLGKTVIIVCNLKTANLRGYESQGMLLAAETEGKSKVEILTSDAPPGTPVLLNAISNQDTTATLSEITSEITIEQFFSVPISVTDNRVNICGKPLTINSKPIITIEVINGKVG